MSVDVFGRTGEREGGAELERALNEGCGEGVVDNDRNLAFPRHAADRLEVDHLEQWIGRAFQPHHGRVAALDQLNGIGFGEVDPLGAQPEFGEDLLEQPHGAAVEVLLTQHQITLLKLGDNGGDGADAGGENGGMGSLLEGGQHPIKDSEVGISRTGVIEAFRVPVGEGGAWEDRWHHRARLRGKALSVVDHTGIEAWFGGHSR